jgi:uncharacterized protein
MKTTLVIGASENPERYSNMAINLLQHYQITTHALGAKQGVVNNIIIEKEPQHLENIHTVTMYLSPKNQEAYYNYILALQPKRIIFNPGTENEAFENLAAENNIECLEACTLVLLKTNQY